MNKYLVNYRVWSDFQTVVEADSEDEAFELFTSNAPDESDSDFIMSDLDYDNIDIMETE
jgi:hypothetical protein